MLLEEMPEHLHSKIKKTPSGKMLQIMDMMKIRMRYIKDIRNHGYFFKLPEYDTKLGVKFLTKLGK